LPAASRSTRPMAMAWRPNCSATSAVTSESSAFSLSRTSRRSMSSACGCAAHRDRYSRLAKSGSWVSASTRSMTTAFRTVADRSSMPIRLSPRHRAAGRRRPAARHPARGRRRRPAGRGRCGDRPASCAGRRGDRPPTRPPRPPRSRIPPGHHRAAACRMHRWDTLPRRAGPTPSQVGAANTRCSPQRLLDRAPQRRHRRSQRGAPKRLGRHSSPAAGPNPRTPAGAQCLRRLTCELPGCHPP
jgi:hypothetical protein